MIKPGKLVYFRDSLGVMDKNVVGLVTREKYFSHEKSIGARGIRKKYYIHWTGNKRIKGWFVEGSHLVEVIKDNVSEG
jgi:hypothetical protein